MECRDTRNAMGFLATESQSVVLSLPLYTQITKISSNQLINLKDLFVLQGRTWLEIDQHSQRHTHPPLQNRILLKFCWSFVTICTHKKSDYCETILPIAQRPLEWYQTWRGICIFTRYNTCGIWVFLLLGEKSERREAEAVRGDEREEGVVHDQGDTFGQGGVVCFLWRSLL